MATVKQHIRRNQNGTYSMVKAHDRTYTNESIAEMFRREAANVWGYDILANVSLKVVIEDRKTPMALGYATRPKVMGERAYFLPKTMTLHINRRAFDLPYDAFRAYMRHEAVHIGFAGHNREFIDFATKKGIPVSENAYEKGGFHVFEKRQGWGRYKEIKTLNTMEEARDYCRMLLMKDRKRKLQIRI